jgi:hypothetical protein
VRPQEYRELTPEVLLARRVPLTFIQPLMVLGALMGFSVGHPSLLLAQATASIQARAQVVQVGTEKAYEANGRALAEALGSMIGQGQSVPKGLRHEVSGAALTAEILRKAPTPSPQADPAGSETMLRTEQAGPSPEVRVTIQYAAN